jgi:hypothetical protein
MRIWTPLVALMLVGCSAGSQTSNATTTSASQSASQSTSSLAESTTSSTARRGQGGKVTAVHNQHVTIDRAPAGDGDTILTGGTVASDSTGSFDLSVGSTLHKCLTDHDSALQVLPTPSVLIAWQRGASWCQKSGGSLAQFGVGPGLTAVMNDPVFAVRIDASGTVLKVEQGFVKLQSTKGASVLVGPGQQSTTATGGAPGPAVPLQADEEDNTNFPPLIGLSPPPAFGRPSPQGSAALARILKDGILRVRFVPPVRGAKPQTQQFSQDFFDFLTRHWDLKLDFSSLTAAGSGSSTTASTPGSATTSVAPGDVRVEPQTGTNAGTPFFTDGTTVWRIVGVDAGLQTALRNFLVAALGSGDYATLFTQVFDQGPYYAPVAGLVGPS